MPRVRVYAAPYSPVEPPPQLILDQPGPTLSVRLGRGFRLAVPPSRGGIGPGPVPGGSRRTDPLRLAEAAVQRFVAERDDVMRL